MKWKDDQIQFSRLLSEIYATGLTPEQYETLSSSMNLSKDRIDEILIRAENVWEKRITPMLKRP